MSLTMFVLRITLALPFWKSGLTKWDGWFTLSFGAKALFEDEFRLHIFGAEYPFPPRADGLASGVASRLCPYCWWSAWERATRRSACCS